MADDVSYFYLRLNPGARHSQLDFDQIEKLAQNAMLETDPKDSSVYFFAVPKDIDETQARQIISTLATMPHIDEAWREEGGVEVSSPPPFSPK